MIPRLLSTGFAFVLVSAGAQIDDLRTWESTEGKKIEAALLGFAGDTTQVQLRLKNGSVYKLPLERFAPADRAFIIQEGLEKRFHKTYSEKLHAHFYSSKILDRDDWLGRVSAYIGIDNDSLWLRLEAHLYPGLLSESTALMIEGDGAPVRLSYDPEEDVETGRNRKREWESIDLSLTDVQDAALDLFEAHEDLLLFFEDETGQRTVHPLTTEERLALREVARTFRQIQPLTEDEAKTWWNLFVVWNPNPKPGLSPTDDPNQMVIPRRPWTNSLGQTVEAMVTGFKGQKIVMRGDEGTFEVPFDSLLRADQDLLLQTRLNRNFARRPHPVDDLWDYYWLRDWDEDRTRHNGLLLAIDPETGEPQLVLQHYSEDLPDAALARTHLRAGHMPNAFPIPVETQWTIRGREDFRCWIPLSGETLESTFQLSKAAEIHYEFFSVRGFTRGGTMDEEERLASLEAMEIYRWMKSLPPLPELESGLLPVDAP